MTEPCKTCFGIGYISGRVIGGRIEGELCPDCQLRPGTPMRPTWAGMVEPCAEDDPACIGHVIKPHLEETINNMLPITSAPRRSRRVMSMTLPGDTFINILLEGRNGFLTFMDNLPKDTRVLTVRTEWELCPPTLCLLLESEEFEEVPDGQYPPRIQPRFFMCDFSKELHSALEEVKR